MNADWQLNLRPERTRGEARGSRCACAHLDGAERRVLTSTSAACKADSRRLHQNRLAPAFVADNRRILKFNPRPPFPQGWNGGFREISESIAATHRVRAGGGDQGRFYGLLIYP
jgi:hypothetical protein